MVFFANDHPALTYFFKEEVTTQTAKMLEERIKQRRKMCENGRKDNFKAKLIHAEYVGDVMVATARIDNELIWDLGEKIELHAILTGVFIKIDGRWIIKYEHMESIAD